MGNIQIHTLVSPSEIAVHAGDSVTTLIKQKSLSDLDKANSGWFFGSLSPTPTPPTPTPTPSPTPGGLRLLHEGRACKSQTTNLGNSLETPEHCAEVARTNSGCTGYFMFTAEYWDDWGCRCCASDEPDEYNDAWSVYSYDAAAFASAGNVVVIKLPKTPVSEMFTVELKVATV